MQKHRESSTHIIYTKSEDSWFILDYSDLSGDVVMLWGVDIYLLEWLLISFVFIAKESPNKVFV